jgi:hypothetical protein
MPHPLPRVAQSGIEGLGPCTLDAIGVLPSYGISLS